MAKNLLLTLVQSYKDYNEKELENVLTEQITQFLLGLGAGFSYMERLVNIKVGKSNFYNDLLFYYVTLHCYVVLELKNVKIQTRICRTTEFLCNSGK